MSQTKTGTPPVTKGEPQRHSSGLQHKAAILASVVLYGVCLVAISRYPDKSLAAVVACSVGIAFADPANAIACLRDLHGRPYATKFARGAVFAVGCMSLIWAFAGRGV